MGEQRQQKTRYKASWNSFRPVMHEEACHHPRDAPSVYFVLCLSTPFAYHICMSGCIELEYPLLDDNDPDESKMALIQYEIGNENLRLLRGSDIREQMVFTKPVGTRWGNIWVSISPSCVTSPFVSISSFPLKMLFDLFFLIVLQFLSPFNSSSISLVFLPLLWRWDQDLSLFVIPSSFCFKSLSFLFFLICIFLCNCWEFNTRSHTVENTQKLNFCLSLLTWQLERHFLLVCFPFPLWKSPQLLRFLLCLCLPLFTIFYMSSLFTYVTIIFASFLLEWQFFVPFTFQDILKYLDCRDMYDTFCHARVVTQKGMMSLMDIETWECFNWRFG